MDYFSQSILIDIHGFDRQHYQFEYIQRESLGEVSCLVFDVSPLSKASKGRFSGRIWVEDRDYNVVRFNGGYGGGGDSTSSLRFDSWRSNVQPGLWLPTFVYGEEIDRHDGSSQKEFGFKAQTRLWGYNPTHAHEEQELSKVEAPINDVTTNDYSPIQAQRYWDRQAEISVIDDLERQGLLAPPGDVDKVLDTVVNNLEVSNSLDIQPEVRCRILMTSTLESFSIGHTIVLSRGLIDVIPDEASLATMLAYELGHVVLGHRIDSQFAFFDQLSAKDKEILHHLGSVASMEEQKQAGARAIEILAQSPYSDNLRSAALFLQELNTRSHVIANLIGQSLRNRLPVMASLRLPQPVVAGHNSPPIEALPIGGRVKWNPWNNRLELMKAKPDGMVSEGEKMPFQLTPFMPSLARYNTEPNRESIAKKPPPASDQP